MELAGLVREVCFYKMLETLIFRITMTSGTLFSVWDVRVLCLHFNQPHRKRNSWYMCGLICGWRFYSSCSACICFGDVFSQLLFWNKSWSYHNHKHASCLWGLLLPETSTQVSLGIPACTWEQRFDLAEQMTGAELHRFGAVFVARLLSNPSRSQFGAVLVQSACSKLLKTDAI